MKEYIDNKNNTMYHGWVRNEKKKKKKGNLCLKCLIGSLLGNVMLNCEGPGPCFVWGLWYSHRYKEFIKACRNYICSLTLNPVRCWVLREIGTFSQITFQIFFFFSLQGIETAIKMVIVLNTDLSRKFW